MNALPLIEGTMAGSFSEVPLVSAGQLSDDWHIEKIVGELSDHELLVSDCAGKILVWNNKDKSCRIVDGLKLDSPEAHVINLGRIPVSSNNILAVQDIPSDQPHRIRIVKAV
ncbi:hypothetical protein [Paenibacillus chungangensis]|uniref:Uncharacterized protein n=1 Tax=Paenibacillus chungangensis TaxID=696535 RepID=A0ABW3HW13_9BACL